MKLILSFVVILCISSVAMAKANKKGPASVPEAVDCWAEPRPDLCLEAKDCDQVAQNFFKAYKKKFALNGKCDLLSAGERLRANKFYTCGDYTIEVVEGETACEPKSITPGKP